ncbi:protein draper isoform X1 [Procambarus clarkii]|uniref:protein draper isoform X1 n=1 Tax=Procambarus clarkii TaxID=6728 RepID=UPI001E672DE6|nr:protein draper-like isoform X1 [Procambarus clarkii]XP_045583405.1 protein draper-like isoform X1 [Procambarus clarkii]XP_045583406.1 protein draper-like isoform X1 [Procambarus clarkii]
MWAGVWAVWAAAVVGVTVLPSTVAALSGPNVCTKQETFTSYVNVSYTKAYRVRTYTYCFSLPPKCSKYKIAYKTSFKTQSQTKTRTVDVCCSGFTRIPADDRCIPICSQDCIHGVCIKPDECRCEAGYSGPSCNISDWEFDYDHITVHNGLIPCSGPECYYSCPEGKWGMGCVHDCPCLHEGKCDPLYGNCSCHAGWIGPYCEEKCQGGYYGVDCKDRCRCQNSGTCDHVSGACQCPPGWTGPLCEKSCPEGTHGTACSNKCQCQNGGHCDPVTGKCRCPSGWTGDVCANPCPQGTWGHNCSELCDCYNSATCDHITGRCRCPSGYVGNKCQEECPLGTYGVNCTESCTCRNEATCSHISGRCFCKDGWLGSNCSIPACPANQYGPGCSHICSCEKDNTERCHPWFGICECKAGWAGETCTRACPFYKFGEKCAKNCQCRNGAFCDPVDGNCICAPGYKGEQCGEHCPQNRYGQNCDLKCRCKNSIGCSHESGKCICRPGWEGQQCSLTCPLNAYGGNCTKICDCQNNGSCDPVSGKCTCGPGHFGDKCEKTCNQGYHGMDCVNVCACVGPNVEGCDPETGRCICKPGFRGVSCESQCPRGFYGESCTKKCDCKNNGSCNLQTGKCICERGWHGADCNTPCRPTKYGVNCNQDCPSCIHGNGTCHPQLGECVCAAGWQGSRCDRTCRPGLWGFGCANECRCRNGAECNHETGECLCLPGWRGGDCSQPCPPGTFGYNCLQTCHCRNHASCRGSDGFCECKPGWMGPGCTQTCPEGYFGRQCLNVCNCSTERFICHPVEGCKCKYGYEGDMCDISITSPIIKDKDLVLPNTSGPNNAGLIVGVISIILITMVIAITIYYRRRLMRLKRELAVVQYIADPAATERPKSIETKESTKLRAANKLSQKSGQPVAKRWSSIADQHHFDNPVYAYQSVSKSQPNLLENGNLNNGVTIKNNLSLKDDKNREWEKLGTFTFHDDACSLGAVGGHYDVPSTLQRQARVKALEADATNPNLNIYHSIESLKDNRLVEHVYDEIKQRPLPPKDPDGEYDHLTYSRPVGEVKPHYYTMASQLRRSADQLSDESPTTGRPPIGAMIKQRSAHSSSSSNELNISRPEISLDDYPCLAQNGVDGGVSKVSNLSPAASDDEYARLKVNNLDVSVDSGKRGAYAKFDDFNVTASTTLEDSNTNHNSSAETEVLNPDKGL